MLLGSGLLPHLGIAGGGGLTGATWAIDGNGRAYNTPTLGAELLTDGGFENWSSATNLTSWTESVSGTSTVNREASDVDSGTYAVRLDVDSSGSSVYVIQAKTVTAGTWYATTIRAKSNIDGKDIYIRGAADTSYSKTLTTSYETYFVHERATSTSTNAFFARGISGAASSSLYGDSYTMKPIAPATLLATTQGTANQTPLAKVYAITTGTQAGAIGWLDNPSNPQNFVIALRNGGGNVNLTKCVAGTYTNLISISSTFVQDAAIEIRRPSGNTFQLWYNGSQVGTNQTINDTAIADNSAPYYGAFSTYSGNTFSEFRLGGNLVPFGF